MFRRWLFKVAYDFNTQDGIANSSQLPLFLILPSANNFAMKGKRKTLNAGDVLSAMEEMEFQRFVAPLKESLEGTVLSVCPGTLRHRVLFSSNAGQATLIACLVSLLFAQHPTLQFAWGITNVHLNGTGITLLHN